MDTMNGFCPECGGMLVKDYGRGEIICNRCGLVVGENAIDHGEDWRSFEGQENNRAHAEAVSITAASGGKGDTMHIFISDYHVNIKTSSEARKFRRLQTTQRRNMLENGAKRSLSVALKDIKNICSQLDLGEEFEKRFCYTYKKFVAHDGLRGRSVRVTCAAVAYAECKRAGVSRTLEEICKVSGTNRRELGRAYRLLCQKMKYKVCLSNPMEYVDRFGSNLGLSVKTIGAAKEMLADSMDAYVGKSPVSLAAAAIYLAADASGEHRTQSQVAQVSSVTEVTVRKICRLMQNRAAKTDSTEAPEKSEA